MSLWHNDATSNERIRKFIIARDGDQVSDLPFELKERRVSMGHILADVCPCDFDIQFYMFDNTTDELEKWGVETNGTQNQIWVGDVWGFSYAPLTMLSFQGYDGSKEVIYLSSGGKSGGGAVGTDEFLKAYSGDTGSLLWAVTANDLMTAFGWGGVATATISIIAVRNGGGVYISGTEFGVSFKIAIVDSGGTVSKVSTVANAHAEARFAGTTTKSHIGGYLIQSPDNPATARLRFIEEGGANLTQRTEWPSSYLFHDSDTDGDVYTSSLSSVSKWDVDANSITANHWPTSTSGGRDRRIALPLKSSFGSSLSPEDSADAAAPNRPYILLSDDHGTGVFRLSLYSSFGTELWRDLQGSAECYEGTDILLQSAPDAIRYNEYGTEVSRIPLSTSVSGKTFIDYIGHVAQVG